MTLDENSRIISRCCILAAGLGTRMGPELDLTHKTLLPIGNKAVITHIIERFPKNTHFVVVIGYLGHLIRDYLAIAHPELSVSFVEVDNYQGAGSGPGYSLYCARHQLQAPFYITASDTIIRGGLPDISLSNGSNWMGVQTITDPENWCTVSTNKNGEVTALHYKKKGGTGVAFTGIAHVRDYQEFWRGLTPAELASSLEVQVNKGFEAIIDKGISTFPVSWIDTGTRDNYLKALSEFPKNFTFTGKSTDLTYRVGDLVVKYFKDPNAARDRFIRGTRHKGPFVRVGEHRGNFFSYKFEEGKLLSEHIRKAQTPQSAAREYRAFLDWMYVNLWEAKDPDKSGFKELLSKFYIKKTESRLSDFSGKDENSYETQVVIINDAVCQPVGEILVALRDKILSGGLPSTFHGDLHDDNVLLTPEGDFRLIDWRESFGGDREIGDRYYDLAKLLHTLTFSVEAMEQEKYFIECSKPDLARGEEPRESLPEATKVIQIGNHRDSSVSECLDAFWSFVRDNHYSSERVELIQALVFLNMSPLYEGSLSEYLYLLGRYKLSQIYSEYRSGSAA